MSFPRVDIKPKYSQEKRAHPDDTAASAWDTWPAMDETGRAPKPVGR